MSSDYVIQYPAKYDNVLNELFRTFGVPISVNVVDNGAGIRKVTFSFGTHTYIKASFTVKYDMAMLEA